MTYNGVAIEQNSMPSDEELRFISKFPDKCCAEVNRRGQVQPCDAVAIAAAISNEAYDLSWWPVCRKHLRGRELVPLQDVIRYLAPSVVALQGDTDR